MQNNGDVNSTITWLDGFLAAIASELTISDAMFAKSQASYQSVGKWIDDGLDCQVLVYPQGSMALGTTIRPLSDKEDYDIDLVCLLRNYKNGHNPRLVKKVVGDRLKAHELYKDKIDAVGEKKRCWTMEYDGFHMDILPCVPRYGIYCPPQKTAICLTHRYDTALYRFLPSDPEKYRDWFLERTRCEGNPLVLNAKFHSEVKPLRQIMCATTLQKAVCILKRHRDVMFESRPDLKPISIIVTTLAAQAYQGDYGVYKTLTRLLAKEGMRSFIQEDGGDCRIPNPVLPEENFAEKWKNNPAMKVAMLTWLDKAREELVDIPLGKKGTSLYDWYKEVLKEAPVARVLNSMQAKQTPLYVPSGSGTLLVPDRGAAAPIPSTSQCTRRIVGNRAPGEQFPEDLFRMGVREPLEIDCEVTQNGFRDYLLSWFLGSGRNRNLAQNKRLRFFVKRPYPSGDYEIYWKVRNQGAEAIRRHCERGAIIKGRLEQIEHTNFTGDHYVECYLVRNGVCTGFAHIPVPINVAVRDDEHRLAY